MIKALKIATTIAAIFFAAISILSLEWNPVENPVSANDYYRNELTFYALNSFVFIAMGMVYLSGIQNMIIKGCYILVAGANVLNLIKVKQMTGHEDKWYDYLALGGICLVVIFLILPIFVKKK